MTSGSPTSVPRGSLHERKITRSNCILKTIRLDRLSSCDICRAVTSLPRHREGFLCDVRPTKEREPFYRGGNGQKSLRPAALAVQARVCWLFVLKGFFLPE